MNGLFYKKNTIAKCPSCLEVVFVLCEDVFSQKKFCQSNIYPDKGMAPWKSGEKFNCRSCGKKLHINILIYEKAEGD